MDAKVVLAKVAFLIVSITAATLLIAAGCFIGYIIYAKEVLEFAASVAYDVHRRRQKE